MKVDEIIFTKNLSLVMSPSFGPVVSPGGASFPLSMAKQKGRRRLVFMRDIECRIDGQLIYFVLSKGIESIVRADIIRELRYQSVKIYPAP